MKTKLFTLEEANQLLPQIDELLQTLSALKLEIQKRQAEIDVLELLQGEENGKENSGHLQENLKELQKVVDRFREGVKQFASLGCELKDLDIGLVDFFSRRGDKIVYLCWKRGEKEICFWHDIETGFASRQPI